MARSTDSGYMLTAADVDETAVRISDMWIRYNVQRRDALHKNEEARQFVFATDINSTSANILPHKNRTHQPKLTEISDNLQSQYWDATLSSPDFFKFDGRLDEDKQKATLIEAWLSTKLQQKKFRETTGRELLADYVNYGNCFALVDYITEFDNTDKVAYKGGIIERISPMDIVFNPQAPSFAKSPKIIRKLVHIAEVMEWSENFPAAGFDQEKISKAIEMRSNDTLDDWVEVLKERGLVMDGFSTFDEYFKQDLVEVLCYYGSVYNHETGKAEKDRVVYVIDRAHVVRNQPSLSSGSFSSIHHAGWRKRNDNLWAQSALDNLLGMQHRIDHLENIKADIFDLIAYPVIKIKGESVQGPEEGFAPGGVYFMGIDEDVEILAPDATALNANTEIAQYHTLMEQFAGSPPETRGIRTPGEKTAFEVNKLDANATKMFVDKARGFEMMLEGVLQDFFTIMMLNFDSVDIIETFDDITGQNEIEEIELDDVIAKGNFTAIGARHWSRRNREVVEMRDFMQGPMQDPRVRAHINGVKLAEFFEKRLGLEDEEIIEPFAGIKEDVQIQAIAQGEAQNFKEDAGDQIGQQAQSLFPAGAAPVDPNAESGEAQAGNGAPDLAGLLQQAAPEGAESGSGADSV